MRFQVQKTTNTLTGSNNVSYQLWCVLDSVMGRDVSYHIQKGDAALVAQALELQEVKTLEQMEIPYKFPNDERGNE